MSSFTVMVQGVLGLLFFIASISSFIFWTVFVLRKDLCSYVYSLLLVVVSFVPLCFSLSPCCADCSFLSYLLSSRLLSGWFRLLSQVSAVALNSSNMSCPSPLNSQIKKAMLPRDIVSFSELFFLWCSRV